MQSKAKKCKGIGKAKSFKGCGEMSLFRKYGLCNKCLAKWMETPEGKKFLESVKLKSKRKVKQIERSKMRAEKRKIKTLAMLKKDLQKEVNTIVRMIDISEPCISCKHGIDKFTRQAHAGHYYSVGSNPSIRFNFHNIHKQCSICNDWQSGNVRKYREGLIERYGSDYTEMVENLPQKYPILKLTKHECLEAIKTAREIIREIKNGKDFTREQLNEKLGLYK